MVSLTGLQGVLKGYMNLQLPGWDLQTRLMEESLKEVAYFMASTAQQFYDTKRTFSVVGTSNNVEEVLSYI